MPTPHGSGSTSPWASTRRPMSRSVPLTRSATRGSYTTNLWDGSRPIDTFVHVYHGPVNYQDVSGRVDRQEQ